MGAFINLAGQKFGHWTVLERDSDVQKKNIYWKCRCDCGTVRSVAGTSLKSGISVSCGCGRDEKTSVRTMNRVEDMAGQRFGMWTVIGRDFYDEGKSKRGARWICRCDCGKEKSVLGYALRDGRSTSCGCQNSKSKIIDLTGQRFGKLLVIRKDEDDVKKGRGISWLCQCDCGNTVSVLSGRLRSGQTESCGCARYENRKHNDQNLVGKKFGYWNVVSRDDLRKGQGVFYICQCDCGTERSISAYTLIKGLSKSCGCKKTEPSEDIAGQHFGMLTVLGIDTKYVGSGIFWECRCDCGTIKSYRTNALKNGSVISCGCNSRRMSSERNFIDISGQKFGRLQVICVDHKKYDNFGNTSYYWKCSCDCGNEIVVQGSALKRGDIKSCGCLQAQLSAKRAKERIIDLLDRKFGLLTVVERVELDDIKNGYGKWNCICECGNTKLADGYSLRKGTISSCGCLKQSRYELYVLQYFDEKGYINSVDYDCQKRFDDLRGYGEGMLSYDFAVYSAGELKCLIECQGQQHYKPVKLFGGEEQFARQQIHDVLKKNYADKIGVPLIEIPYTVEQYEDVKQILLSAEI